MTQAGLLAQYAANRDAEAFAQIVTQNQRLVFATCQRKLRNPDDVDDAVQETFLRLVQKAANLHTNLGGWLHACAVNVAIDINRRRESRSRHESASGRVSSSPSDPPQVLAELREHLDAALEKLDPDGRELIIQRFFVGRTQAELAAESDVSPSTLSGRMDRAIAGLREKLRTMGCGAVGLAALLEAEHASASVAPALTANLMKIGLGGVTGGAVLTNTALILVLGLAASIAVVAGAWLLLFPNTSPLAATAPAAPPPLASTAPAADPLNAADIYLRAAALIKVDCPAASNDLYPDYPPFGNAWETREQQAWDQNRPARDLARQAAVVDTFAWPVSGRSQYLNPFRALANDLGDAALYEHEQGHDAEAVDSVRDILHMADLLDANEKKALVCNLVGEGCTALAVNRLMIIFSNVALVADDQQTDALPMASAKKLIASLLVQTDADTRMGRILKLELAPGSGVAAIQKPSINRATETFRRANAERTLAAMSLASHLLYFEKKRWPNSAEELASMLPGGLPKDPWGDGSQTFGYVLIKGGLPDGSDRPLVYDRYNLADGMFFRVDQPEYSFYNGDGSKLPPAQQKHGGQFWDVASWVPAATVPGAPTTRPLP